MTMNRGVSSSHYSYNHSNNLDRHHHLLNPSNSSPGSASISTVDGINNNSNSGTYHHLGSSRGNTVDTIRKRSSRDKMLSAEDSGLDHHQHNSQRIRQVIEEDHQELETSIGQRRVSSSSKEYVIHRQREDEVDRNENEHGDSDAGVDGDDGVIGYDEEEEDDDMEVLSDTTSLLRQGSRGLGVSAGGETVASRERGGSLRRGGSAHHSTTRKTSMLDRIRSTVSSSSNRGRNRERDRERYRGGRGERDLDKHTTSTNDSHSSSGGHTPRHHQNRSRSTSFNTANLAFTHSPSMIYTSSRPRYLGITNPLTIHWFFSIIGSEYCHIYFWIIKDLAWTQNWRKVSIIFGILALVWSLVILYHSLRTLNWHEIWNFIASFLWLFANFW